MASEAQLLSNHAIMREQRRATNKKNSVVKGFCTDGLRYTLMAIENDGIVQASVQLTIGDLIGRREGTNYVETAQQHR